MEDDAIQTDVSRQDIMEEMRADRAGTGEVEVPAEQQDVESPETVVDDDPVEEQPPEEDGFEFYTPDGKVIRVPKSARYKAKLDGEETEVDIDRITRSYQKGAAADKRLEEAARRAKELEQYERTLAQRLQEVRQQEAAAAGSGGGIRHENSFLSVPGTGTARRAAAPSMLLIVQTSRRHIL